MEGDKFISTSKHAQNKQNYADEDNFFLQSDGIQEPVLQTEPFRHLNDYDFNILRDDAYKDVSDELFKLEYKISKTEDEIKEIDKQILLAQEISDTDLSARLNTRKKQLKDELKNLSAIYQDASFSAKISGGLDSKIRDKFAQLGKLAGNAGLFLISKLPGKLSSIFEIKNSLIKLENINKSVDELMNCQCPYGEAEYRYEKLSKYIARANSIQSEIYKFMK